MTCESVFFLDLSVGHFRCTRTLCAPEENEAPFGLSIFLVEPLEHYTSGCFWVTVWKGEAFFARAFRKGCFARHANPIATTAFLLFSVLKGAFYRILPGLKGK